MKHLRLSLAALLATPVLLATTENASSADTTQESCQAATVVDRALPRDANGVFAAALPSTEALLLIDRTSGVTLVEQHADAPRVVASTIKILTALTVVEHADINDSVLVSPRATRQMGATMELRAGVTYPVRVLLEGLIVRSGNDAAVALAEHVGGNEQAFVALMRQQAEQLGVTDAVIGDPSGLADSNRLSARQLAVVADAALDDPLLANMFAQPSFRLGGGPALPNRNVLIERFAGATGVKTGFTTRAGHAIVASAKRGERELLAVVLSADGDSLRFERAEQLLDFGFSRTFGGSIHTELSWVHASGTSTWQLPPTRVVAASGAVALRWSMPQAPSEAIDAELTVDQQPFCVWQVVPDVVPHGRQESMGTLIRDVVSHGYGATLLEESSGSLRVPLQGAQP